MLARLREEFAAGRLSHETFMIRMDSVLQARHLSDLPPLLADLGPGTAVPALPVPGPAAPIPPEQRGPFPPAAPPSVTGRLRAALDRWLRPGAIPPADPASLSAAPRRSRAFRLTGGMPPASEKVRRPLPLQFPRGSGTFFSIGRDVGCDLAIADMTVSRMHARLERTSAGWLVTDLASTNGTRVNGWLVRGDVQVTAGDLVSFGKAEFWLTAPEAP